MQKKSSCVRLSPDEDYTQEDSFIITYSVSLFFFQETAGILLPVAGQFFSLELADEVEVFFHFCLCIVHIHIQ